MTFSAQIVPISRKLEDASNINSRKQQIEFLRKVHTKGMLGVLKFAYDPEMKIDLPEGAPPYKPCDFDAEGALEREIRLCSYLTPKSSQYVQNPMKREQLFIQLLEVIDKNDAQMMIKVKDQDVPLFKTITKKLIEETFPGLL